MSLQSIVTQRHDSYCYLEINPRVRLSPELIQKVENRLAVDAGPQQKVILGLPSCLPDFPEQFTAFFAKDNFIIVPVKVINLSPAWGMITERLKVTDKAKAVAWIQGELPSKVSLQSWRQLFYLKFLGDVGEQQQAEGERLLAQVLQSNELTGEILTQSVAVTNPFSTTWLALNRALIIDIADMLFITQHWIRRLQEILAEYRYSPSSPGDLFCDFRA